MRMLDEELNWIWIYSACQFVWSNCNL